MSSLIPNDNEPMKSFRDVRSQSQTSTESRRSLSAGSRLLEKRIASFVRLKETYRKNIMVFTAAANSYEMKYADHLYSLFLYVLSSVPRSVLYNNTWHAPWVQARSLSWWKHQYQQSLGGRSHLHSGPSMVAPGNSLLVMRISKMSLVVLHRKKWWEGNPSGPPRWIHLDVGSRAGAPIRTIGRRLAQIGWLWKCRSGHSRTFTDDHNLRSSIFAPIS